MKFLLPTFLLILFSCSKKENTEDEYNSKERWTVDSSLIKGELELFELMNDPQFKYPSEITKLNDDDLVAVISFNDEVRVYPYYYTNYYEVVNDVFFDKKIAISYCPITKTAICFDREINNVVYDVIASGYLYKDNMVASDTNLNLYWSQILMTIIRGENIDKELNHYNLIEMKWKTIVDFFPNSKVFYHNKISNKTSNEKKNKTASTDNIYGISNKNNRTNEEIIELYSFDSFNIITKIITKIYNNKQLLIIGNTEKSFITSYYQKDNLEFYLLNDVNFPNILKDNEGNVWNIFGFAVEGQRKGEQLESPKAFAGQFWAWNSFYQHLNLN